MRRVIAFMAAKQNEACKPGMNELPVASLAADHTWKPGPFLLRC